jgi:AcrR family transcriptional regulator
MDVSVRAAARRASLIELGRRAFAERSYDEVTTQFLAESGGMSMGLLYRYFGDKRGFYLACLQDAAGELLSLLHFERGPIEATGPAAVTHFLDVVAANPGFFRGVLRGGIGADPEAWRIVQGVRDELVARIFVAVGRPDGGAGADPAARLAVHAWLGGVEAATLHWLDHPGPDPGGVERRHVEQLVLFSMPTLVSLVTETR